MSENKYKVVKRILNENNVDTLTDEQFVKLLEEENITGDGKQNALDQATIGSDEMAPFLNGGCAVTGC